MSNGKIVKNLEKLLKFYKEGEIPRLEKHEVNPDLAKSSRENYLYFTLPVSINFQRSSPAMWNAAFETWNDENTKYLFFPEKVVNASFEQLQEDLTKYKLALQKNKHVQIWQKISTTLFKNYDSDPRKIFLETQKCVTRTKNLILENKKSFPYLSGPKMFNYWLFILSKFTDIKLRNAHKISIIPDTHIKQASLKLGISTASDSTEEVERLWFSLLKGTNISPVEMHPVLWHWSRNKFRPDLD